MPKANRFVFPLGKPGYLDEDKDDLEFAMGSGEDLPDGTSFRRIELPDQWLLANARYRRGGPLVVSDFRGKDGAYRTWRVEPRLGELGRGVVLHPLHDGQTFFRGRVAHAVEPLMLSQSMKSLIEYISKTDVFNRVSAAAETGRGWGDTSRWVSLLHNYGFVRSTGTATVYTAESPEVRLLKSEKDREHGPGNKMNYEKAESWPSLVSQFEAFSASKLKSAEVEV